MAVTFTFSANTKIKSSEVNQNFTDIWPNDWAAWTPTFTRFSANPTVVARWMRIGSIVFVHLTTTGAGTSNATTFTITNLPATPLREAYFPSGRALNGGASLTTPCRIALAASSATATLTLDMAGTAWTGSGGKYCDFYIWYEV